MSRALHPQYRAVMCDLSEKSRRRAFSKRFRFDAGAAQLMSPNLQRLLDDQAMCVLVGYPNFFGVIEDPGADSSGMRQAPARN